MNKKVIDAIKTLIDFIEEEDLMRLTIYETGVWDYVKRYANPKYHTQLNKHGGENNGKSSRGI